MCENLMIIMFVIIVESARVITSRSKTVGASKNNIMRKLWKNQSSFTLQQYLVIKQPYGFYSTCIFV